MANLVSIDHERRRTYIRAHGQWTIEQAERYLFDMRNVLAWSRETGEPISIYADLDGLVLHTAEVSRCIEQAVSAMREFPLKRYALIVPSYLMRMQCRRLLAGIDHSFFDTQEEAYAWLGWEQSYAIAA